MNRLGLLLGACLGLFTMGCGGSNSASYSCDITKSGTHTCSDYSVSVTSGDISALTGAGQTACTSQGGTSVASCSHTGAVGGCKITSSASSGGNTVTNVATSWYYSGTAANVMTLCTAANGTFVTP